MSKGTTIALEVAYPIILFVTGFFVGEFNMKNRVVAAETQRDEITEQVVHLTVTLERSTDTLNRCNQALRGAK